MGFQSAFNQLLATAGGAMVGAKHIEQQKAPNKLAMGEEYGKQFNMAKELAGEIGPHMNQLNAVLRGGEELNKKALSGGMTRKAYEKAFQKQQELGNMLMDQNQQLVARQQILQNRIAATQKDIVKAGFGKAPIAKSSVELKDMRNDPSAMLKELGENDAKWKALGRPRKEKE